MAARWGVFTPGLAAPEALQGNSTRPLSGEVRWFLVRVDEPELLGVAVDRPAVLCLSRALADESPASPDGLRALPGEPLQAVEAGAPACRLDRLVAPGRYLVGVRGAAGDVLSGEVRFTGTCVEPMTGPVGPETLVGGGENRAFRFTVEKRARVGIGLRAGGDVLECRLFGPDGRLMSTGIQQFLDLPPGEYVLTVSAAPGQAPVSFAPVVLGLKEPPPGPPETFLREFFKKIGSRRGGTVT